MANVDLKSLFTSEKQYTVLQLLNVLIDEVGKSMIKTATINQDVDAGTLTLTITLSDDNVVTASTDLKSLTDTEKSLISMLTANVNTTNEGVTFLKVVGFEGNETHKGNEIHHGYESHLGDESHAGTEIHKGQSTFTDLHTDDITATDGQDLLSYDGTNTALKGKGTRPLYNSSEMALKTDITEVYEFNAFTFSQYTGTSDFQKGLIHGYATDKYVNIDGVIALKNPIIDSSREDWNIICDCSVPNKWVNQLMVLGGASISDDSVSLGTYKVASVEAECMYSEGVAIFPLSVGVYVTKGNANANWLFRLNLWGDKTSIMNFKADTNYLISFHIRIPTFNNA